MEIKHQSTATKGSFYIEGTTEPLAEMSYVWAGPQTLIIDHTEVSPTLKGQGVGAKLTAALVEYAREKQIKVIPLCPFAKSVFDKTPEYRDVL
ncbi:MAG: N-acetyltransferase [Bacteroidia bacterium]|jgi:hypothetical protein|nr:N-acetyltransferase [Bacteroidia bacterium]